MALDVKATLRVYSEKYTLDQLSKSLGSPTRGCSIGDAYSKSGRTRNTTFWGLESTAEPRASLDDHLAELLKYFASKRSDLEDLRQHGCEIDLSCFFASDNGQGGATLSPQTIKEIGALDVGLAFDFYSDQ